MSDLNLISNFSALDSRYEMIMGGCVALVDDRMITMTNSTYFGEMMSNSDLDSTIGGLIGKIKNSSIEMRELVNDSNISVKSTGRNIIGGILGESVTYGTDRVTVTVTGLTNKGFLVNNINKNGVTGGIIGVNQASNGEDGENTIEIVDTHNEGDIRGVNIIGGVLGLNSSASIIITDTHNQGSINSLRDSNDLVVYGWVGGIVGKNEGFESVSILNTYNSGDVKGDFMYTGGIIGKNFSYGTTDIIDSYNNGVIAGNGHTGGVIGENKLDSKMTMLRTYNKGSIISSVTGYLYIGGLIGSNKAPVTELSESYNRGAIVTNMIVVGDQLNAFIGGLIGRNHETINIENTYNTGDINISSSAVSVTAGGLIGFSSSFTISESYNAGDIVGSIDDTSVSSENYIGGIVGSIIDRSSNVTVADTYNTGDLASIGVSGGIIGNSYFEDDRSNVTISKSFSYGDVYGYRSRGAILGTAIGLVSVTFINNYWYAPTTPSRIVLNLVVEGLKLMRLKMQEILKVGK